MQDEIQDWQQRLIEEKQELEKKSIDLDLFITKNELFYQLDSEIRYLLVQQSIIMKMYLNVLEARIALFK
jgi:hypothetical protein